ncbi:MAG: hypothetical protein OEM82_09625, partial [Acidobacteriota bacterium]|nr:hypothetical protein [Acidobacteriota bacterium]
RDKVAEANAYIDQLERRNALNTEQIARLRHFVKKAEVNIGDGDRELNVLVTALEKQAGTAKSFSDPDRLHALAGILKRIAD